MARPSTTDSRRAELLPVIAQAFADQGYRRTTTAELARRTGVQETILYRMWPDKRAMFVAAIGHVYRRSEETWSALLEAERPDGKSAAELLIDYESRHLGELGLHRIVFAGLSETDDPEIREALRDLYRRFQRFIRERVRDHRAGRTLAEGDPDHAAWALLGVGTVANVLRELGLVSDRARARLVRDVGRQLIDGEG